MPPHRTDELIVGLRTTGRRTSEMSVQTPLPAATAFAAVARSCGQTARLIARRRLRQPRRRVGLQLEFSTGTSATVYRETVIDRSAPTDPCVLVVCFRLKAVRGRGHAIFRAESLLNTPLFAGFPGLVCKLWCRHDEHGVYRGVYQWDGEARAESYARSLWRILALVSTKGSIGYHIIPQTRLDDLLSQGCLLP
jgi:hypothetical protein